MKQVAAGTAADKAGFRAEDRVVALDGATVLGWSAFFTRLQAVSGDKSTVTVTRNGVRTEIVLPLPAKNHLQAVQGIEIRANWRLLHQTPFEQISQILGQQPPHPQGAGTAPR
ncbi:MAG: PDZ domain-containing protein [Lacunisphaera sp.]